MLKTIKGYYDKGQIVLHEPSPVKNKTEVIVTFLTEENAVNKATARRTAGVKGKLTIPDDFNDLIDNLKDYM